MHRGRDAHADLNFTMHTISLHAYFRNEILFLSLSSIIHCDDFTKFDLWIKAGLMTILHNSMVPQETVIFVSDRNNFSLFTETVACVYTNYIALIISQDPVVQSILYKKSSVLIFFAEKKEEHCKIPSTFFQQNWLWFCFQFI